MESHRSKSLMTYYYEFKDTKIFALLVFLVTLVICAYLSMNFLIPQFQKWMEMNGEIEATKERIQVLEDNVKLIRSVDDEELESNLLTISRAFPVEKDFGGAMQAILSSAVGSGVSVDKFSFAVGEVSTKSAVIAPVVTNTSVTEIIIKATGNAINIKDFMKLLSERIPLSKVMLIEGGSTTDQSAKITIDFPAQPIADLAFTKTTAIQPLTQQDRDLFAKLTQARASAEAELDLQTKVASDSSLPSPF